MRDIASVAVEPDEQRFLGPGGPCGARDVPAMQRATVRPPEPHLFVGETIRRRRGGDYGTGMERQRILQPFDGRSQNRGNEGSERSPSYHAISHGLLRGHLLDNASNQSI